MQFEENNELNERLDQTMDDLLLKLDNQIKWTEKVKFGTVLADKDLHDANNHKNIHTDTEYMPGKVVPIKWLIESRKKQILGHGDKLHIKLKNENFLKKIDAVFKKVNGLGFLFEEKSIWNIILTKPIKFIISDDNWVQLHILNI